MNSLSVKAKFQKGLDANLTLKGQGQGHHFSNPSEIFRCYIKLAISNHLMYTELRN